MASFISSPGTTHLALASWGWQRRRGDVANGVVDVKVCDGVGDGVANIHDGVVNPSWCTLASPCADVHELALSTTPHDGVGDAVVAHDAVVAVTTL